MKISQTVPSISSGVVAAARAIITSPLPMIELPDPEAVRAVAIASDTPKETVREYGLRRYDHATTAARIEAGGARRGLDRHRERLTDRYRCVGHTLRETNRLVLSYGPRAPMTHKERLELAVLVVLLIALLAASMATIKTIALDTGIVPTQAQAVAFALVPAVGAFLIAQFVTGLPTVSGYRRARRAANISAMVLLALWTCLFVTVFGTGATAGIDDIISGITSGDGPSGVDPFTERAFFIVAVLFEILGGASVKLSIQQVLTRGERCIPERSGVYAEREHELKHASSELGEIESVDAALAARLDTIAAGRVAYADAVLALLLCPPAQLTVSQDHADPSRRSSRRDTHSLNGRIS